MDRFQLSLEIALSVLLLVTIFYSLYLGRALSVLRRDRHQLDALIASLQSSSTQAKAGIDHLRQTTEIVGRALSKTVESGQTLKRDLVVLCERSETLAQQLETLLPLGRVPAQSAVADTPEPAPSSRDDMFRAVKRFRQEEGRVTKSSSKGAAEREFIRALRERQG
ncbi:DUF6468 domain-containing protein [Gluconobacter morbifer]|uniref:DUF6468 domain-containing protein n=1 Tax=Gluconobacter morbifer G707 TaxID=1088869 RepID=G6XJ96_9PROT|nr:DUF6468 domain-containing protein [Gluconobacter morbifer]EHH68212.1 hypothetical protein GMO_15620 [Gluconobacter morbifer G707]